MEDYASSSPKIHPVTLISINATSEKPVERHSTNL
jgi:hypothetical protein